VSGLGAEEAARLAGEAVAWLAGGRGLLLLQRFWRPGLHSWI